MNQIELWKQTSEIILMIDANGDMDDKDRTSFVIKTELSDVTMGVKHGY